MKSKSKTYLLLTGVLLIWGIIVYKIIIGINPVENKILQQDLNISFSPEDHKEIDTFSIQNTKKDPFLGTLAINQKKATKRTKENLTKNQLGIIYKGLVKKQNTSDKIFIIHIENSEYLLKSGQTINNIQLVSGSTKSIKIRQNNTYQIINRQ